MNISNFFPSGFDDTHPVILELILLLKHEEKFPNRLVLIPWKCMRGVRNLLQIRPPLIRDPLRFE